VLSELGAGVAWHGPPLAWHRRGTRVHGLDSVRRGTFALPRGCGRRAPGARLASAAGLRQRRGAALRQQRWTQTASFTPPAKRPSHDVTIRRLGRFPSAITIAACHLAGRSLEGVGVEQRLMEVPALEVPHFSERRVDNDLPDAAAELRSRHWWRLRWVESLARGPRRSGSWS
jgi:hypothetical protein